MDGRKLRVGVIFGGRSGEHQVSLWSAASVMRAMDPERYEIVPIGITQDGHWIAGAGAMALLDEGEAGGEVHDVAILPDPTDPALMRVDGHNGEFILRRMAELDVIFPVLHGPYGEDGTIQGLLELAGIPYVGAGVVGSAVGMDKAVFKAVMIAHGLPVLPHRLVLRSEWEADRDAVLDRIEADLDYPMFTKPANLGSSVGISKVRTRRELAAGLDAAARYDRRLLVEKGINAREIEVSVLGNDAPIASIPGEIVPGDEFYSYKAKYLDDSSELLIPAPISDELAESAREMAVAAYRAIDCAGLARCDFLLDRDTGKLYVNEINTIPGFTRISMYPKLWEATGIPYPELIDRLIELALERYDEKSRTQTSYEE